MTRERKAELLQQLQRFLAQRERSRREIIQRIKQKKICEAEEEAPLLEYLEELKLIDDERFAANRATYRLRSGYGPLAISRELALLGIARSVVDRAMPAPEEIVDSIQNLLQRRNVDQKFLLRRGFPGHLIARAQKEPG